MFDDAGAAYVRDRPDLLGAHVVIDGNAYAAGAGIRAPLWLYKAGWDASPGLGDFNGYRSARRWEAHGLGLDPAPRDPAAAALDYAPPAPAAAGSLDVGDALGRQLGARGLPAAPATWTRYA